MTATRTRYVLQAMLAAVLFGASPPLAKLLLGKVEPVPMAALLYLGSAIGLILYRVIRRLASGKIDAGPGIERADLPWLAGATLAGGVAAPIVLMFSLRRTPAATASLLLSFEGVATTLIATLVFSESVGKRVWAALICITAASIALAWDGGTWGFSIGAMGILGACLLWGLDNNFTRNLSTKDPLAVTTVKGLVAGGFSLLLVFFLGAPLPDVWAALGAMALGFVSYGLSIVLFIMALQGLGAARTSAWFGTAPFVGSALSLLLFLTLPTWPFFAAMPLMILGAVLLFREDHRHRHIHAFLRHEHRHTHDEEHYRHTHEGTENIGGTNSHPHAHETAEHDHPHAPDIHHRHDHSDK